MAVLSQESWQEHRSETHEITSQGKLPKAHSVICDMALSNICGRAFLLLRLDFRYPGSLCL